MVFLSFKWRPTYPSDEKLARNRVGMICACVSVSSAFFSIFAIKDDSLSFFSFTSIYKYIVTIKVLCEIFENSQIGQIIIVSSKLLICGGERFSS